MNGNLTQQNAKLEKKGHESKNFRGIDFSQISVLDGLCWNVSQKQTLRNAITSNDNAALTAGVVIMSYLIISSHWEKDTLDLACMLRKKWFL